MYFASLQVKDKVYLDALKIAITFYSNLYDNARELAINKLKLYATSEYKMLVPVQFDLFTYLILNKDVLFANIDPYKHYYEYGVNEQRIYCLNKL